ncbi:MAG: toll/interleukin-1 receptor domain-containing protein, partial [Methyloligellaceae bacterium]
MARVYISCAEQDRDLSARIKDWLRFQDYEPVNLHDNSNVETSNMAQWHREYAQTLEQCDLVILVLTPDWVNSKWSFAEFTEAYSIGKT